MPHTPNLGLSVYVFPFFQGLGKSPRYSWSPHSYENLAQIVLISRHDNYVLCRKDNEHCPDVLLHLFLKDRDLVALNIFNPKSALADGFHKSLLDLPEVVRENNDGAPFVRHFTKLIWTAKSPGSLRREQNLLALYLF